MTDVTAAATGSNVPAAPLEPGYRRYAIGLLFCVYVFNFIDRQIVTILAEPIKRDLDLADWQLGLMTGTAFAIFYCTLGIPIARLAERRNRPWIIGLSLAAWSGFTALCAAWPRTSGSSCSRASASAWVRPAARRRRIR
jgi:MFS family permease